MTAHQESRNPGHTSTDPTVAAGVGEPARWTPPQPAELPEWRTQMLTWLSTYGQMFLSSAIRMGRSSLAPELPADEAAQVLAQEEYERLRRAELYYATADMARLARTAAATLPNFNLAPEDLPSPYGFLVFEEEVGSYINQDFADHRLPFVAFSWGQWDPDVFPHGGVWITFYTPTSDVAHLERIFRQELGRTPREAEARRLRAMRSLLTWDNEMAWGYWPSNQPPSDPTPAEDTLAPVAQVLRAAWMLMGQSVTTVSEAPINRATRRRAQREGRQLEPVRIVHLRQAQHEDGAPTDQHAAREWTCRWLVSGHWRNQWYPSRQDHRPVWIAPHVKGPEDKPLRTQPTVHVWNR